MYCILSAGMLHWKSFTEGNFKSHSPNDKEDIRKEL